jgi:hypothetical protein
VAPAARKRPGAWHRRNDLRCERDVFLTADKGILKCHSSLFERGLAIMNPTQLLDALDDLGELDGTRGGDFLVPDLSTLSRLYAGFSDS